MLYIYNNNETLPLDSFLRSNGITQTRLASLAGVHPSSVSHTIRHGDASTRTLRLYRDALHKLGHTETTTIGI